MKQLLPFFLLLFPAFALAQYPGNANQKITLGEQTTADGLIWRGVAADTTLTAKSDTAAYFVLDTVNINLYTYKASATGRKWRQLGADTTSLNLVSRFAAKLNISDTASMLTPYIERGDTASMLTPYWRSGRFSGVLPVANGGTNTTTLTANKVMVGNGTSGVLTPTNLHWDNINGNLLIGTTSNSGQRLIVFGDSQFTSNTNTTLSVNSNGGVAVINLTNTAGTQSIYGGVGGSNAMDFYTNSAFRMRLDASGNLGIGTTSPTAVLHLKAGTATANTAPLKFTSGTNLTTAEAGAMEFNGTNLFFSPSTTRHTVNHGLTGSATLDFGSTNAQLSTDLTITVTGAADGDVVSLGVPNAAVNANTSYSAWVSAANTVTVRFNNYSSGTVNPASGTFKVFVTK